MNVTLRKIGNSVGVILPKDLLDRHNVQTGDRFTVVEEADGIRLIPMSAELEAQLEAAREGMNQYRNALRELAK